VGNNLGNIGIFGWADLEACKAYLTSLMIALTEGQFNPADLDNLDVWDLKGLRECISRYLSWIENRAEKMSDE
jgi:hypothetical protein